MKHQKSILIIKFIPYYVYTSVTQDDIHQTLLKQIQTDKLKRMKHSQFRIRNAQNKDYRTNQANSGQKANTLISENQEYVPSSSSFAYDEPNNSLGNNDAFLSLFKNLMESLQQLSKSPLAKRNDLQVRDRSYLLEIPKGKSFLKSKEIIKKWIEKMISNIVSIAFNYFSNDQFTYEQAKIFCSENILSNLAALVHKYKLTSAQLKQVDEFIRDDVLELLSKKYPMTETIVVNRSLQALAKAPDLSEKLENDFFSINNILFQKKKGQYFSKQIKLIVNTIINRVNEENKLFQQSSNFEVFQKLMAKIFELVEDSDWMSSNEAERSDAILGFIHNLQFKQSKSAYAPKQSFFNKQADILKRQFKEKVKQYTSYLIGRKVSENVAPFSEEEMEMSYIEIKNTSILRILTKWCEELWQKFIPKNYYVNKTEDFRLLNGQVKSVSQEMRSNLDKLMQSQKAQIKVFMAKVTNDNYDAQINLLNQLLQNSDDEFWDKNLQKISEKFSVLIGKSLEKWVVKYLNRLIEGLTNVSNEFYQKYFANEWPSPPNLITFKIGDLMRCKCSSGQRQIRYIFQNIKWLSQKRPEILSITRIKNRLSSGTNDILMNIKFCDAIICEIQLAVNSKKSKFIKSSNVMSHYLYEVQRSLFGPINQLGSIWRNLDLRAAYFDKNVGGGKSGGSHRCEELKKAYQFEVFDSPFICSQCNITYSQNNMVIKHVKCSECSFWKCSLCQIKQISSENLAQMFISNAQLRKVCEKKVLLDEQNKQLPIFGVSVHLNPQKKSEVFLFKRLEVRGVNYLFARQFGKLKLLLKITHEGAELQYLKEHIVFEVNLENGTNLVDLNTEQANQQYFLPLHLAECYKNHKTAITLQNQPINNANFGAIFDLNQQQQLNISSLSLTNTNLKSLPPLGEVLPNLETLTLCQNKDLLEFQNLPCLLKLKQIALKNTISLFEMPKQLFQLPLLLSLSLKDCLFSEIPEIIGNLKSLKFLNISNSSPQNRKVIRAIPKRLYELIELQQLNLSNQFILELDSDIGKLNKLRSLNIRRNGIEKLPDSITRLTQLEYFDFRENPLKELPKSFTAFRKLKQLRLQLIGPESIRLFNEKVFRSYYSSLPQDLQENQSLTIIEIHSQNLQELPPLEKCLRLEEINLFRCALVKPPKLKNCQSLKKVNLKQQMIPNDVEITCITNELFREAPNLTYFSGAFNTLKTIPSDIKVCTQLIELDLCKNSIQELCEQIGYCRYLQRLNLWSNQIKALPNSLKNLTKLQYLSLGQNKLTKINESLSECIGLHELILFQNSINYMPQSMGNLINLQILDLQDNMIGYLPKTLNNLKKIKPDKLNFFRNPIFMVDCMSVVQRSASNLSKSMAKNSASGYFSVNLNSFKYTEISRQIKNATFITEIVIKSQSLETLPNQIQALTNLVNAQFKQNKFKQFPLPLTKCLNLVTINFDNNEIQSIPAQIGNLPNLSRLDLCFNKITTIDQGINRCHNLTVLSLQQNKLTQIGDEIFSKLQNLIGISISGNMLTSFPLGLLQCVNLKKIDLSCNKIKHLQGSFAKLSQLKVLLFGQNEFTEFPEQLCQCQSLLQLNLDQNKIARISQNLYKMSNLSDLSMYKNGLTQIPRSIGKAVSLKSFNLPANKIEVIIKELEDLTNIIDNQFNLYNNPIKKVECHDWIMRKGTNQTKAIVKSLRK